MRIRPPPTACRSISRNVSRSIPSPRRIRLRLAAAPEGGPLDHFPPDRTDIAACGFLQQLRRRSAWSSTFVARLELTKQGDAALAQEAFLRSIHVSAATPSVSAGESRTASAACANRHRMSKTQTAPIAGFTPGERDYIRRELDMFFSTLPTVAEGFQLKTWRGGPEAGRPKLSPSAKGLLERGLMRLDTSQRLPRLFFTEAGLAELRRMMADRRLATRRNLLISDRNWDLIPARRFFQASCPHRTVSAEDEPSRARGEVSCALSAAAAHQLRHLRRHFTEFQLLTSLFLTA